MWPRDGSTSPFVRIVAQSWFPFSGLNYAVTPHPTALTSNGNPLTSGSAQDIRAIEHKVPLGAKLRRNNSLLILHLDLTWTRDQHITAVEAPGHTRPLTKLHRASLVWVTINSLRSKQTTKLYLADGSADGQKTKGNSSGKCSKLTSSN